MNFLWYEEFVVKQALPGINVMKFPTNAQPEVLRALLNGAVDVAVERPETIQYYNSKVPFSFMIMLMDFLEHA